VRMVEKAMEFVSELEGSEKEALINTLRDITEGKVSTPPFFSSKMEKKLMSKEVTIDLFGSSKSTYHSTTRNDPRKRRKDERSE